MNLTNHLDEIIDKRRSVRIYDTEANFDSEAVVRSIQRATLSPNSSNFQLWEFYHISSKEAKAKSGEYCLGQPAATTANELVVIVARRDKWKQRAEWNIKTIFKENNYVPSVAKKIEEPDSGKALRGLGQNEDKEQRMKSIHNYYSKLMPTLYRSDMLGLIQYAKKLYVSFKGTQEPTYREVMDKDIKAVVHKSCALAAQTFMLSMAAEGYGTCPMEGFDSKRIKKYLNLPKAADINMVISCGVIKPEGIYGKRQRVDFKEVYKKV